MANLLAQNPIHISGTMASSYKAAVASSLPGSPFTLMIQQLRWLDIGLAGDEVLIIDPQSGIELVHLKAVAASSEVVVDWSAKPRLWRDFQVVQFASGQLDIFTV